LSSSGSVVKLRSAVFRDICQVANAPLPQERWTTNELADPSLQPDALRDRDEARIGA